MFANRTRLDAIAQGCGVQILRELPGGTRMRALKSCKKIHDDDAKFV